MRTISFAQNAQLLAHERSEPVRVEVKDSGGTWRDLSSYPGYDAVKSVSWGESVDDPVATCDLELVAKSGTNTVRSLLGSTLLALNRELRVSVAIIAALGTPLSGDWFTVFHGRIWNLDEAEGAVKAKDLGGVLQDKWMEKEWIHGLALDGSTPVPVRVFEDNTPYELNEYVIPTEGQRDAKPYFYKVTTAGTTAAGDAAEPAWPTSGTVTSGGVTFTYVGGVTITGFPIEQVIQTVLDANGTGVTLYVPVSPGTNLKPLQVARGGLLEAIRNIALSIGWDLRYGWRTGTSQFELTLYVPNRGVSSTVRTFSADDYKALDGLAFDLSGIRNSGRCYYSDEADLWPDGTPKRKFLEASDSASITKYGLRYFELSEASSSPIDTSAEASTMLNAAVSDMCEPNVDLAVTFVHGFPFAQLQDFYKFTANNEQHSADLSLAVVEHRHEARSGHVRTTMALRGKPTVGADRWHAIIAAEQRRGGVENEGHRDTIFQAAQGHTLSIDPVVGGVKVSVAHLLERYAIAPEYEIHASPTSGFIPDDTTLVGVTRNQLTIANQVPGRPLFVTSVPRLWNRSRPVRSLPGTEYASAAGQAQSGHLAPEVSPAFFPYNFAFEHQTGDSAFPPDQWDVGAGLVWGTDATTGVDPNGGRTLILLDGVSTTGRMESSLFPVKPSRPFNLDLTYKATGANAGPKAFDVIVYFWKDTAGTPSATLASTTFAVTSASLGTWLAYSAYRQTVPADANFATVVLTKSAACADYKVEVSYVEFRGARVEPGAAFAPLYQNSWADAGGFDSVSYWIDVADTVHIQGVAHRSSGTPSANEVIFPLPSGYRPAGQINFATNTDAGHGAWAVKSNGDVVYISGGYATHFAIQGSFGINR